MNTWLEIPLSNALSATVLAAAAWVVARVCRRPQIAFAVWALVLAKLIAPPVVGLPLASLRTTLEPIWQQPQAVVVDDAGDLEAVAELGPVCTALLEPVELDEAYQADTPDAQELSFEFAILPDDFADEVEEPSHELTENVPAEVSPPAPAGWPALRPG